MSIPIPVISYLNNSYPGIYDLNSTIVYPEQNGQYQVKVFFTNGRQPEIIYIPTNQYISPYILGIIRNNTYINNNRLTLFCYDKNVCQYRLRITIKYSYARFYRITIYLCMNNICFNSIILYIIYIIIV